MKAVLYLRFSSDKQNASFSIEEQLEACTNKAKQLGYEVVKVFEDKAQSAKTTNRPALTDILAFATDKKNDIDALIVYDISRLSRNQIDFAIIKRELANHGVIIHSVQGMANDTLEGDVAQDLLARVAQYKNEIDTVKIKGGMHKRYLSGLPQRLQRGYKWELNAEGRKTLVPDETFEVYRKLWIKTAEERLTLPQALKYINHQLPKAKMNRESISNFLANKFYYGILTSKTYNEEVKGQHIPMIDEATYWKVREVITGRSHANTKVRNKLNDKFPLKDSLRCPNCGGKITGASSKGKNNYFDYYFCRNRAECKYNKSATKVHESFINLLKDIEPTDELMTFTKELMRERYETRFNDLNESSAWVQKDIKRLEDSKKILLDKLISGVITDEEFKAFKSKIELDLIPLKALESDKQLERIDIETVLNFVEFYMKNIHKIWERSPIEVKMAMQCSTFPKGLYFENDVCRTPQLSQVFKLNEILAGSNEGNVHIDLSLSNTLLDEMLALHNEFSSRIFLTI